MLISAGTSYAQKTAIISQPQYEVIYDYQVVKGSDETEKYIMDKSGSTPPMPQNKQRVVLKGLMGQQFTVLALLQRNRQTEQTADAFGKHFLGLQSRCNISAIGNQMEGLPVGTNQSVSR